MRIAVLAVLLAAASPQAALAQPFDTQPYGTIKLGGFAPTGDDMEGLNNGAHLGVTFGRRIAPNVAAEFGLGWFGAETDTMVFFDPSVGAFEGKATLSVVPLTGALKLIAPSGPVQPYVEAGLGIYFARLEAEAFLDGFSASDSARDTALGLHVGGGVEFAIAPRASLLLEARYLTASAEFDGIDMRIAGVTVNAGLGLRF